MSSKAYQITMQTIHRLRADLNIMILKEILHRISLSIQDTIFQKNHKEMVMVFMNLGLRIIHQGCILKCRMFKSAEVKIQANF